MSQLWKGYNNIGICATAINCTLSHCGSLSLPKALLIMPLAMHAATIRFLANANVRERQVAALVTARPDLFSNYANRFEESLIVSLNAIQFLLTFGHARLDSELKIERKMEIDSRYGKRALLIEKASKNIAGLLRGPDDDLYLNLRIKL